MLTDIKTPISHDLQERLETPYMRIDEIRADMVVASATPQDLVPAVRFIHDMLGGRFITSAGADTRPALPMIAGTGDVGDAGPPDV